MSQYLRTMPPWPNGQPLPTGAITFFYDPGTDKEYQLDPARLGGAGSGETAALVSADPATGILTYEAPRFLAAAEVDTLGLAITTSAGTTHTLLANLTSVYDSGTGELTVELPAGTLPADVVSIHLYRPAASGQEQMLSAAMYPFAYTNDELDARLATKQGAVVKTTRAFVFAATATLSRIHYDAYCFLSTQADCVIDLPVPTLSEVGRILVVNHYANDGVVSWQVSLAGSATTPTPPPPEPLGTNPQGYVTLFEVVAHERGTPYDDTVATWVVLSNSPTKPPAKADLVGGTVPTAQLPGFATSFYEVKAADVALPAKALTIPVPTALFFVNVQVIGTPQLAYGSHYTSQAGQLTIDASVVATLQVGDRVRYSYQRGGGAQPGGPTYTAGTNIEISALNELSSTTLALAETRSASYILQLSDAGRLVPMTNTSPATVTVPDNATVPFPIGTTLYVAQDNTGTVTIAPGTNVVIRVAQGYGLKVPGAWLDVALHKRDTNTWVLKGGIT